MAPGNILVANAKEVVPAYFISASDSQIVSASRSNLGPSQSSGLGLMQSGFLKWTGHFMHYLCVHLGVHLFQSIPFCYPLMSSQDVAATDRPVPADHFIEPQGQIVLFPPAFLPMEYRTNAVANIREVRRSWQTSHEDNAFLCIFPPFNFLESRTIWRSGKYRPFYRIKIDRNRLMVIFHRHFIATNPCTQFKCGQTKPVWDTLTAGVLNYIENHAPLAAYHVAAVLQRDSYDGI